jgi:ribokinase
MKVLNFGSLNIDYVYSVPHFVRPGETIRAAKLEVFCGGKGLNQSVALSRAGAEAFHAGRVGGEGGMLTDILKASGVDVSFIGLSGGPSGHAIIQVDESGENCIIINGGANIEMDEPFIDGVLGGFSKGDICLLQNEINNISYIMKSAHERGLEIAFNPSPMNELIPAYPMECVKWFILNEVEGRGITGETHPEAIADALLAHYPQSRVVLTLGRKGVFYKDAAATAKHGIYKVERVDTTGAGDTFTGYFLAGAAAGLDINETLRRASVASSLAVAKKGAAVSVPILAEVLAARLEPM